ncbi:MAG: non-canonical purine NTP diphosphatase [Bacteroidales bacterium]|nr:non-canonical purine NTP diphosphatase [Bacteroidales bacterium]
MRLVFATNNDNKVREINHILGDNFSLLSLGDLGLNEDIPENEPTIEGNALHKARYIYNRLNIPVFADDTGLEIDALNGLPGVHSARFAGDTKDSAANIEKVLCMMKDAVNRSARFRTVIALIIDDNEFLFEGVVKGTIISEKRGKEGFGYDPVFVPEGQDRTFAEMLLGEKNQISHRAIAFEKLKTFLNNYPETYNKPG